MRRVSLFNRLQMSCYRNAYMTITNFLGTLCWDLSPISQINRLLMSVIGREAAPPGTSSMEVDIPVAVHEAIQYLHSNSPFLTAVGAETSMGTFTPMHSVPLSNYRILETQGLGDCALLSALPVILPQLYADGSKRCNPGVLGVFVNLVMAKMVGV